MLRRILVPLNGSAMSEVALPVALDLARDTGARLELVVVRPMERLDGEAPWEWIGRDPGAYLERLVRRPIVKGAVRSGAAAPSTVVLDGDVAEELIRYGSTSGADLFVMSTHGRGPFQRLWIGSVTDRLAREATIPVLAVHPDPVPFGVERRGVGAGSVDLGAAEADSVEEGVPSARRRVLVPLDGSALAEEALPRVTRLLGDGISVTLFRVVTPPDTVVSPYLPDLARETREILEARKRVAEAYLDEVVARFRKGGVSAEGRTMVGHRPSRSILDEAAGGDYDLIAMSTHGRSGLTRAILGSVTEKILRETRVPVLVFRPEEDAAGVAASTVTRPTTAARDSSPRG